MAKKSLINKANATPKFKVRGYTPAAVAVALDPFTASSASAECAFARWPTLARSPALPRRVGEDDPC